MNRFSGIAVSIDNEGIRYTPLGSSHRRQYLLLDNTLLDIVSENIPKAGKKEIRNISGQLLSKHIPEHTEDYCSDVIVMNRKGKTFEILLVIIRRTLLEEIRKTHPRLPMYSQTALERIGKGNTPTMGQDIFSRTVLEPLNRILTIAGIIFLVFLSLYLGVSYNLIISRKTQADNRTKLSKQEAGVIARKQEQIKKLEEQWQHLEAISPRKISRILEYLAILDNSSLQAQSIHINGRFFRLQAFSTDALRIGMALEKDPVFHATKISNIRLHNSNGLQAFTLEGYYAGN